MAFIQVFMIGVNAHLSAAEPSRYRYMKVADLHKRVLQGQKVLVIDVRSNYAYQMEHIKDSISLPLPQIKQRFSALPADKDSTIITYCSCPHHIAEMASDILKEQGYQNVFVLDEGLPGWKRASFPLSGDSANQPISIYWVIGYVVGEFHKPVSNLEVRVYHPRTEQLEFDKTGKDGFYAIPLRFYGLRSGDQMQASFGSDTIFFVIGPRENPWGIRIDDEEAHLVLLQKDFLKTFKSKKLHL